eukprot:CAMPEP_0182440732 /NCGR_PEP_ID=MMETSP1167-20130531/87252_1 /TAXON_ID=2988 /ORGANISM="Mallomonas Sp, Strain CCMP3275" /LENGTH=317 /DNA_ID=CAMNT_0024634769 /DNA_START=167 /DNA_END=1117 /DNA_ORIENTATION=-
MGSSQSKTAIEYAQEGDMNSLYELLDSKPLPIERNEEDETVLHWACYLEDIILVQKLLTMNHDLNPVSKKGYTPMHCACRRGNSAMVKLLTKYGARHDIADNEGVLPIHLSLQYGHTNTSRLLLTDTSVIGDTDDYGIGCIHYSCYSGEVTTLKLLVEALVYSSSSFTGPSLDTLANSCTKSGMVPVHFCHTNPTVDCLDLLLQLDANICAVDQDGNSVLHKCAIVNNSVLTDHILHHQNQEEGSQSIINIQNMNMDTALHIACSYGHTETCLSLLRYGALTHILNQNGRTALLCMKGTNAIRSLQCAAYNHDLYNW